MKKKLVKTTRKITRLKTPKSTYLPWSRLSLTILAIASLGTITYLAFSKTEAIKPMPIGINEISPAVAGVSLALPSQVTPTPGSQVELVLTISAGSASIGAAQVELNYDPAKITDLTLVQGDFLTDTLGSKVDNGQIYFIYTTPLGSLGKAGTGNLATLKFTAPSSNTSISFHKNTMIAALGTSSNVLTAATGTNINVGDSTKSTQSNQTLPPPALIDIQPAPATQVIPIPESKNLAPSKPAISTVISSPDIYPQSSYLPENDYDYSTQTNDIDSQYNPINDTINTESSELSAFARFLEKIKSIFGANKK